MLCFLNKTLRSLTITNVAAVADNARKVGYFGGGTTVLFWSMSRSLINTLLSQKLCQRMTWSILFIKNFTASKKHSVTCCGETLSHCVPQLTWMTTVLPLNRYSQLQFCIEITHMCNNRFYMLNFIRSDTAFGDFMTAVLLLYKNLTNAVTRHNDNIAIIYIHMFPT